MTASLQRSPRAASGRHRETGAVALERDDRDARQLSNHRGIDHDQELPVRDRHQLEVRRGLERPGWRPLDELHDGAAKVGVDLAQAADDIARKSHVHELGGAAEFFRAPSPPVQLRCGMTLHCAMVIPD